MSQIEVEKIIEPLAASDGAGVKLKRSIGTHLIDYHDPFLMLDEFGSENKDDDKTIKVIAGKFKNSEGPVKGHNVEPVYFDVEIEEGKEFNFNLPSTHNSLIYLIEGEIKVGDNTHDEVKDSNLIILTRAKKLKVYV